MLQIREGQSENKLSNHNNYLWNRVELLYQGAVVKVSLLSKPPTRKKEMSIPSYAGTSVTQKAFVNMTPDIQFIKVKAK